MGTGDANGAEERVRRLLNDLDGSVIGGRLRDPEFRRRHAYEALLRHPDPVMREIGDQLRHGLMRPADILRAPCYLDAFQRAIREAQDRLGPEDVANQLRSLADKDRGERPGRGGERSSR